ncbi:hypothetical protein [Desulfovibrio sp. An276]|uniref:hypothetical protein n=1 Tax=Desulfovibrio sp. An276 TaxID=1965618 RepID=UPI0013A6382A|nr:hypothetical protein [Desulfovibrio sp. An276]
MSGVRNIEAARKEIEQVTEQLISELKKLNEKNQLASDKLEKVKEILENRKQRADTDK